MTSTQQKANDEKWMKLALKEAAKGVGRTSPNPVVGALVVKAGRVVGRGYHRKAGTAHAEVVALKEAGKKARGACLYTTLEPCNHHGKTPPCTDAILEAGIQRVVFASNDPNPLVNGRGVRRLRRLGLDVVAGVLEASADALNRPFFKVVQTGLPWVTLKAAVTLDGKLATASGDSQWVSGEASRRMVHALRNQVDAVLVGRGTAQLDNPLLTARLPGKNRNPLRVVVDSHLSLPKTLQLFSTSQMAPTLVATLENTNRKKAAGLQAQGVDTQFFPEKEGRVDLEHLLRHLAQRGVSHLLVEGGAALFASLLTAELVDSLLLFVAPKIIGNSGLSWVGELGVGSMQEAMGVTRMEALPCGQDVLLKIDF